jgi:hypothetical protein
VAITHTARAAAVGEIYEFRENAFYVPQNMCVTRGPTMTMTTTTLLLPFNRLSILLQFVRTLFVCRGTAHTHTAERTTWQILFPIFIFMLLRELSSSFFYCYTHSLVRHIEEQRSKQASAAAAAATEGH